MNIQEGERRSFYRHNRNEEVYRGRRAVNELNQGVSSHIKLWRGVRGCGR